jgi:hypothetical protein
MMLKQWRLYCGIVILFFLPRLGAALISGFDAHIPDSPKYLLIAQRIAEGHPNFVLDKGLYVSAPLYPWVLGLLQKFFGNPYIAIMQWLQLILVSIVGIIFYKLALLIFKRHTIALVATVIFGLLPTNIFFSYRIAQEPFFIAFFVTALFYLFSYRKTGRVRDIVLSAVFYSLAFLTKSNIAPFSPALVVVLLLFKVKPLKVRLVHSLLYGLVCFAMTIPYGLFNLHQNGTYTLSSSGPGFAVYFGNTEMQYRFNIQTPPKGTEAYYRLHGMDFSWAHGPSHDSIMAKPIGEREPYWYAAAWKWVKENPKKFIRLKAEYAMLHLIPSVSYKHYSQKNFLMVLLMLSPIYLLAYAGIGVALKKDYRCHAWIGLLFAYLFTYSVVIGTNARYRTCMLEPFYIYYAVFMFHQLFPHALAKIASLCHRILTLSKAGSDEFTVS